jgi:hypothetical protein
MESKATRIRVASDSELGRFLDRVGEMPVLLEKNGKLYRLVEETGEQTKAGYDANKVKEAIRKTAGSWADIDADQFLADLYRAREEGSRPADRP